MKKGIIFVVSGPSGSGKGTIVRRLVKEKGNMFLSTSWTTRGPRPGEVEGDHYHYVTREEFDCKVKENGFLEWAEYATHDCYGTLKKPVCDALDKGMDVILEIDVQGAMKVREAFPDTVLVMLTPTDSACLEKWLRARNENDGASEEKILERLRRAKEEILYVPMYDYHVYNKENCQAECIDTLYSIMQLEHLSRGEEISGECEKCSQTAEQNRTKYKTEVVEKFK